MAGHSQFKNIMRRKGAQDAKRAKVFTKIMREINAACKSGAPDPAHNPRLRAAVLKAKQENISKDRIDDALKRASGQGDTDNYEEVRYEGYGPGGVAVIVEALTDNRNRTAPEIRAAFSKAGGNLGESGSVSFMFDRVGIITYPAAKASEEAMLEGAIEAGAVNCESDKEHHQITCSPESFGEVRDALEKKFGEPQSAKLTWLAKTGAPVNEEQAAALLKMIDVLEDNDDVQEVFANYEIADDILERLSA
ncbi:MAG TPA: YebC/PmpR family DNA-binding transcriptional regulator [Rickettsiales bacterium]|nr:YebC/PmpR family DNA-binding transcriptional regulator [Rickettsiales bacterium]